MGSGFGKMVDTFTDFPYVGSNFMAINIEVFCEPNTFVKNVDLLIDEIKSVRISQDADEIYMPGEIEFRTEAENMAKGGVPLQPFQIAELDQLAGKYGLSLSDYLS